jgi:hypothetical protein
MSGHWMDGADARLVAALSQSREIARGLAGIAAPPIHAQDEEPDLCGRCYGHGRVGTGRIPFYMPCPDCSESERELDCRDLAAGLATAAKDVE